MSIQTKINSLVQKALQNTASELCENVHNIPQQAVGDK